jgi:hypothetical protein
MMAFLFSSNIAVSFGYENGPGLDVGMIPRVKEVVW